SEDDTHPPLIIGCLPAQEARRENDPAPVENVQMHLDRQMFIGADRLLQLADGVCLYLGEGSKVTLDAGSSTVQVEDDGLTLSSPRISFASKANGRSSGDPDAIE
ncbi:Rhs element Vgr protein, partial [Pseudomonas savastanoi pv. glycinea]